MGIFLSGRHDEQIDRLLEFLEGYIWKTERVELGKIHTVYFALKYLALHMSASLTRRSSAGTWSG